MTLTRGKAKHQLTEEQVRAIIYDDSARPARLPAVPPDHIEFAVVKEDDMYVAAALNIDIASQGETMDEAEENLREAITLYYHSQWELLNKRTKHVSVITQGSFRSVSNIAARASGKITKRNRATA